MKKKLREFVIAAMLIVMTAALSVTLFSCSSSEKSDESSAKAKIQSEAVMEDNSDNVDDNESSDESDVRAESKPTNKSDGSSSGKSDSKSKDGSGKSESSEKTAKPTETATQSTTKAPDVCYITIEGYCSSKSITLQGGDTVYSVLCRSGASVSGSGNYVKGINGKFEFDEGPTSGWTYYVNGFKPGVSCGSYTVSAGDSITWDYVTSY